MGKKNDAPQTEPDALAEGTNLLEGTAVLATAPLLAERAQIVVPKKGKLFEERTIEGGYKVKVAKFAIIRPCQSKGKAIRGFQPIYEAQMLAKNAGVFTGWQMFMDHVAEELAEAFAEFLQEKGRSSKELGGRLLKTWYDPEMALETDEENGFRKGGVVGELIPYKPVREMMEDDPFALAVSINAWPTAARIGRASWDTTKKGAVIEGIRSTPQGSVDFVPRAGAGGRFLTENATPDEVRSAVSLLESAYSAHRADDEPDHEEPAVKKLSEMNGDEVANLTAEQLSEALAKENPSLAESLKPGNGGGTAPVSEGAITKADLDAALNEQREALTEEFKDSREASQEMAEEIVEEREGQRVLAGYAEKLIRESEDNGLPGAYGNQIRQNYLLTESGPRPGIVVTEEQLTGSDGETLTAKQVVEGRIKADLETSVQLIEAAGGVPRIKGLHGDGSAEKNQGGGNGGGGGEKPRLREGSAFTDFLRESGDLTGDNDKDLPRVREMVEG